MRHTFFTLRPGRLPYRAGLALQEEFLGGGLPKNSDLLILLEHPPTITLGRGAEKQNLLSTPSRLKQAEIETYQVARGGDVTFHGPGQIVGYPLIDLNRRGKDLHRYLRDLEEVLIQTLAIWGMKGTRQKDKTGVWIDDRKIASIGVGVRKWISWHGFALNLETDLTGFEHIVPCGLADIEMTSMKQILGLAPDQAAVEDAIINRFSEVFNSEHAGNYARQTTPQTGLA